MKPFRRKSLLAMFSAAALALSACAGQSSTGSDGGEFPAKPITMIVPYEAGGNTDTIGRAVANGMEETLGTTINVVNRPGAGGIIGVTEVSQARADGYTIGHISKSSLMQSALQDTEYTTDDFDGLGVLHASPDTLAVNADSEWVTISDLASTDTKITYGVPGTGSTPHLNSAVIFDALGVDAVAVPFDSVDTITRALLAGDIDAAVIDLPSVAPQVENGDLRVLAVGRVDGVDLPDSMADAPDLGDHGVQIDELVTTSYGVVWPKGTPEEVKRRLTEAVTAATQSTEVQKLSETLVKPVMGETESIDWVQDAEADADTFKIISERFNIKTGS